VPFFSFIVKVTGYPATVKKIVYYVIEAGLGVVASVVCMVVQLVPSKNCWENGSIDRR